MGDLLLKLKNHLVLEWMVLTEIFYSLKYLCIKLKME